MGNDKCAYLHVYIMYTLWLFNIAMENPIFKFGKPSISMGHLYHGYVSHNQRVYILIKTYINISIVDQC